MQRPGILGAMALYSSYVSLAYYEDIIVAFVCLVMFFMCLIAALMAVPVDKDGK